MGKAEVKLAGMGEIVFARGAGVLGCIGLGSCVGTVLFDPRTQAAALAHVMLPEAQEGDAAVLPGKYATTALPALLRVLDTPPALASRLKAILVGGASCSRTAAKRCASASGMWRRSSDCCVSRALRWCSSIFGAVQDARSSSMWRRG